MKDGCVESNLYNSIYNGNLGEVQDLINKNQGLFDCFKERYNKSPLHVACVAKVVNVEIIKLLLENNPQCNTKDSQGRTPLDCLVFFNQCPEGTKILSLLLNAGADVNQESLDKMSTEMQSVVDEYRLKKASEVNDVVDESRLKKASEMNGTRELVLGLGLVLFGGGIGLAAKPALIPEVTSEGEQLIAAMMIVLGIAIAIQALRWGQRDLPLSDNIGRCLF